MACPDKYKEMCSFYKYYRCLLPLLTFSPPAFLFFHLLLCSYFFLFPF